MLSNTIEGDGLECLADIPRDIGCFLIPLRVEMNISMSNNYVCVGVTVLLTVHLCVCKNVGMVSM